MMISEMMITQSQTLFVVIIIICVVTTALTFYAFTQKKVPGANIFGLLSLNATFITLAEIISMLSETEKQAAVWFNLRTVFIAFLPVVLAYFILKYYQLEKWVSKRTIAAFCVIPVLTIIIAFVPQFRTVWVSQEGIFYKSDYFWLIDIQNRIAGIWLYVNTFYGNLLLLTGIFIIIMDLARYHRIKKRISILLIASTTLSIVGAFFSAFSILPFRTPNPFTIGLGFAAVFYLFLIVRTNFLKPGAFSDPVVHDDEFAFQNRRFLNLLVLIFVIATASISSIGFITAKNYAKQYRA